MGEKAEYITQIQEGNKITLPPQILQHFNIKNSEDLIVVCTDNQVKIKKKKSKD